MHGLQAHLMTAKEEPHLSSLVPEVWVVELWKSGKSVVVQNQRVQLWHFQIKRERSQLIAHEPDVLQLWGNGLDSCCGHACQFTFLYVNLLDRVAGKEVVGKRRPGAVGGVKLPGDSIVDGCPGKGFFGRRGSLNVGTVELEPVAGLWERFTRARRGVVGAMTGEHTPRGSHQ